MTDNKKTNPVHHDCLMKEKWAVIEEKMDNSETARVKEAGNVLEKLQGYIISQTEINTSHAALISKLMHRIYGNTEEGLTTTIKLNKQRAASDTLRVEESLKRLWWAFGVIALALIGNLVNNLFFSPK
jgi:hypothetical protein